jgi:hypothetical protein
MNNELQISSAIQLVLDLSIEMSLSIPQPLFTWFLKNLNEPLQKRLNWNNEGQWLGTKDQISYCLLVGLVFIHLIHMSLSRYLLDTVFVLACTIFHSERENTNVTENSRNYVSRGFKMHQGTRVDVMRCNSVTKHVYMYYGAFVLWCSSSSVEIKKATTIILNRVLIREANKCKEVKSCSPTLETGNHLGPYWMESRLDQLE